MVCKMFYVSNLFYWPFLAIILIKVKAYCLSANICCAREGVRSTPDVCRKTEAETSKLVLTGCDAKNLKKIMRQ